MPEGDINQIAESPQTVSTRLTAFQTTLMAGGIVLFLMLLYEMRDFLNPPLVAVAAAVVLWPLRSYKSVRAILVSILLLVFLWFLDELAAIIIPFGIVYLFAYLFDPVVTALHTRYGVPRWVSSLLATALLLGLVALFILLLVPNVIAQFEVLFRRLTDSVGRLQAWLQNTEAFDNLEAVGINKQIFIDNLRQFLQDQATAIATGIPTAVQTVMTSLGAVLSGIAIASVLPVVHFYLLKDYPFIKRRLVELFPTFGGRRTYLMEAGSIVGNYLRGQLLICAIAGFNVSVALILFDVPFALLIGIVSGLLNLIPHIGIIIANVMGILIGVIFGDPWYWDVIIILAVLLGESILEQTVLTPNIMSYQVGLHPVIIIISLFVFGYFMGWIGLLIAVPMTALIMTVYKTYRDRIQFELSNSGVPPDASV